MENLLDFKNYYHKLDNKEKASFIDSLNKEELIYLYNNPLFFLQEYQIPPDGNWRYHYFQAGRGGGKTFTATSWLYNKIINGAQEVAIVGPSYVDLVKEILPVFESHFLPSLKPKFNSEKKIYKIYNDCIVKVYSSLEEIRGCNAEYGIAEEICKWCDEIPEKIELAFSVFEMAVRKGPCPQIFIASTPKPYSWFINYKKQVDLKNPYYSISYATTKDNKYLSEAAKSALYDRHAGTRTGRQELEGEILMDIEGALWSYEDIANNRITVNELGKLLKNQSFHEVRTVIAVDPSVTNSETSDETGIISMTLMSNNHVYVMEDASGKYDPLQWANKTVELYHDHNADKIIAESNQGGKLVEANIRAVDKYANIGLVHAKNSKMVRAEPVANLYKQGLIHHVGEFKELENQMTTYNGNPKLNSPDRMDALVYGITELLLSKSYVRRDLSNLGIV